MNTEQEHIRVSSPGGDMSLGQLIQKMKEWYRFIKKRWLILFLAGVLGGVGGYLYAYYQKPTYLATLTFALEDEKGAGGGLGGALGLASTLGIDLGGSAGGAFAGANLIELMKSRKLIEEALLNPVTVDGKVISLAEMYIQLKGWRTEWIKNKPGVSEKLQFVPFADRSTFSTPQDSVLGMIYSGIMKDNLNVAQKDKKVSIISIDVVSEYQVFSKLFAEKVAAVVSDFYAKTKSAKAKLNVSILERQADSIKTELNNAITGMAAANDNTFNLNPALNVKRTPSTRKQVDIQMNSAILGELVKNLELAKVQLRKETPLIQVIDRPILPLKKMRASKLVGMISMGILAGVIMLLLLVIASFGKSLSKA